MEGRLDPVTDPDRPGRLAAGGSIGCDVDGRVPSITPAATTATNASIAAYGNQLELNRDRLPSTARPERSAEASEDMPSAPASAACIAPGVA